MTASTRPAAVIQDEVDAPRTARLVRMRHRVEYAGLRGALAGA